LEVVVLTALGVGSATVLGSVIGFAFKNTSGAFADLMLSFAAGVMLASAVWGLIDPALEYGVAVTVVGVAAGALALNFINKAVTRLSRFLVSPQGTADADKVLLFVAAIAIHNLPEGIAAGVGFGTGDTSQALMIAGGIALQNIPEGMVIIGPMLAVGVPRGRTFLCALGSGLVEVVGTLLGYFFVRLAEAVLPFMLAFAGGTMLYVIADEMIPDTHTPASHRLATYALIFGFCFTLVFNAVIDSLG